MLTQNQLLEAAFRNHKPGGQSDHPRLHCSLGILHPFVTSAGDSDWGFSRHIENFDARAFTCWMKAEFAGKYAVTTCLSSGPY
jgi:hypothetical protein